MPRFEHSRTMSGKPFFRPWSLLDDILYYKKCHTGQNGELARETTRKFKYGDVVKGGRSFPSR